MFQQMCSSRTTGAAALLSVLLATACDQLLPPELLGIQRPAARPSSATTPTPAPQATPTRGPEPTPAPEPEPDPVAPQQYTRGSAVVHISGINRLRLRRDFDTVAAASFTWELAGADRRAPVVELSIRGTRSRPCLAQPCKDDAGLVVRVTANPDYDGGQRDEARHCGSGVNYHRRLALGPLGNDGGLDVALQWDEGGLRASTPVDSVFLPSVRRPGSLGFGRFLAGAPFAHGERGFSWDSFSIQHHGGGVELRSFTGQTGRRISCP